MFRTSIICRASETFATKVLGRGVPGPYYHESDGVNHILVYHTAHSDMAQVVLHRDHRVVLEPDPQLLVRILSACIAPLSPWHLSSLLCTQLFHIFTLARLRPFNWIA